MKIAIVAPSCTLKREAAEQVQACAALRDGCEILVHPQCFLSEGHFAGPDAARLSALREVMADPSIDAVWFARGGYGSNRIALAAVADLPDEARHKTYLGYSDAGFLLAAFHKSGLKVAHGPMPQDVLRNGGEQAIDRALDWLLQRSDSGLEAGLDGPAFAFNLTVLSNFLGTELQPDFAGRELIVEDVGEHLYRTDRSMFHITSNADVRKVRRLRLGRVSDVIENEPDFGSDEERVIVDWCERSGIAYGGRADIGHDSANKIVPFS
ncbi:LD-carboxypeptidase [Sphingomonas sp. HDW15A]|uniref:LD-carboxypeptidase n=1 Tax=Sphingomonas sp. HDW15A TaxID=2714942 RepID=UPI00140BC913|nr:LD-carboxypeptidase [Sphingomonas sp. HDW15A]QIK96375.1 LD-carboxypeptidase [Sphingomonas sp. HDW15A]